ncbi:MAG: S26 family signal peptidase [Planctomycetota bacterium]|nr:S26 family signal peptidase [Planctomycetota bacterium]
MRDGSGGVRRPERVEQAAYGRLPEDELVRFAVENLDDRLRLELDGEVVLELDVEPAKEQQSTVSIAVRGDGADLEDLMVYRDIHYLPQGMPAVVTIPAGHYFMLGDNTQDSADSRDWREITYAWHRPDGATVRWRGNARRGGRDKGGWENPLWGLGDGGRPWYGFKDEWGDRHWFPAEESQPGFVEEHAPLVPRHLIQGRAVAIFWPILPHKGIWRLGWLH